jgi:endo-1,4-beta-xylanase
MQNAACTAIVVWGVTDKDSWVPNTFSGWGDALLFDSQLRPKLAYWSVHNALAAQPSASRSTTSFRFGIR